MWSRQRQGRGSPATSPQSRQRSPRQVSAPASTLRGEINYAEDDEQIERDHPPFLGPVSIASYGSVLRSQAMGQYVGAEYHFSGEGADFHYYGIPFYSDYYAFRRRRRDASRNLAMWRTAAPQSWMCRIAPFAAWLPVTHRALYQHLIWRRPPSGDLVRANALLTPAGQDCVRARRSELAQGLKGAREGLREWYRLYQFDMLFPRSSYLDQLAHLPVQVVAPYLSRSLLLFAFSLPPDILIDEAHLDYANDYASAKRILRELYPSHIPAAIRTKRVKSTYNEMALASVGREFEGLVAKLRDSSRFSVSRYGWLDLSIVEACAKRITLLAKYPATTLGIDYLQLRRIKKVQDWLRYISDRETFRSTCFSTYSMAMRQ